MQEKRAADARPESEIASGFLQNVRHDIPLAIEQIDILLRLLTAARPRIETFLDLGSGNPVLTSAILDEFPHARGVIVANSETLLAPARQQLRAHGNRIDFVVADCCEPAWIQVLAGIAPFDAVVAISAAQTASGERKRELFGEIFHLLKAEGIFINIDHVASSTRWNESVWNDYAIDAIFGQHLKHSPDKSRAEIAHEYYALLGDKPGALAPLEVQCDWLRELGFESVDCYLKVLELAVFGGQKPEADAQEQMNFTSDA